MVFQCSPIDGAIVRSTAVARAAPRHPAWLRRVTQAYRSNDPQQRSHCAGAPVHTNPVHRQPLQIAYEAHHSVRRYTLVVAAGIARPHSFRAGIALELRQHGDGVATSTWRRDAILRLCMEFGGTHD